MVSTWRMNVDLPPMLGPVMSWNQEVPLISLQSFLMKSTLSWASTHGCLAPHQACFLLRFQEQRSIYIDRTVQAGCVPAARPYMHPSSGVLALARSVQCQDGMDEWHAVIRNEQ